MGKFDARLQVGLCMQLGMMSEWNAFDAAFGGLVPLFQVSRFASQRLVADGKLKHQVVITVITDIECIDLDHI